MPFELMTIEHLGLRLYSTLPPVISEFVSNAYDGESPKVEVQLPVGTITKDSEVIVRDFGHGMSAREIQAEFLPIGRNRRGHDSKNVRSKNNKRHVTGRKGLGKLSAFGIATEIEVRSIKDKESVCLRLNYNDMKEWFEKHSSGLPYQPEVVKDKTGTTDEKDGVEITLRQFHRTNAISEDVIRRGLATRLSFIGRGFEVNVNGKKIVPKDRLTRKECTQSWDVDDMPGRGWAGTGRKLTGWVGFVDKSSQKGRGVDIYAIGKAVELGSFFNYPSTHVQFARAHLVGQIHADFLDSPEADHIATARNSVVWESEQGLESWGHQALRWAFEQWLSEREKGKEEKLVSETGFSEWMKGRNPREKRVANRMVKLLVKNEDLDADSAKPLLEIVKSSVETVAFHELVDAIETEGGTPTTLLKLFDEWRVIEAREHLKLAHGRLEALDQLEQFIEKGALEVRQMQPLLVENPWIIDEAWTETHIEQTYTKLLKKNCKEAMDTPEKERRLDIWGVRPGTTVTVVELKRPEKTLSWKDLDQIERYVRWARTNIQGTGPHAPRYVNGLLVVGNESRNRTVTDKRKNLAGEDIRVETYRDLYVAARSFYDELDRRLQTVAPEYSRRMKRARRGKGSGTTKATAKKAKPRPRKKTARSK